MMTNLYDSDDFAAVSESQEEYDDRAGEGLVDTNGYNGDGRSVSSSSNIEESFEVSMSLILTRSYRPSKV